MFYICLKLTSKKVRYFKLGRAILETNSTTVLDYGSQSFVSGTFSCKNSRLLWNWVNWCSKESEWISKFNLRRTR